MALFRNKTHGRNIPDRRGLTDDVIRVVALTMHFEGRRILKDIDMAVKKGEIFVIMGPSGCGKTTLVKHMCGLLPPDMGTVYIHGRDIYLQQEEELNKLRRRMGMAFQGGALINSITVLENIVLPLKESTGLSPSIIRHTARIKLDMVGLLAAENVLPADLSGGMRKRAAIARAIALDPDILFFDEPSAGLDPITAVDVDNLILKLNKVFGITMVIVTHDIASAFTVADKMVVLSRGQVVAMGDKEYIRNVDDKGVQDFINRQGSGS